MSYMVRMLRAEGPYSVGHVIPAMPGNMARMYEARGIGRIIGQDGKLYETAAAKPEVGLNRMLGRKGRR